MRMSNTLYVKNPIDVSTSFVEDAIKFFLWFSDNQINLNDDKPSN